MIALFGAAYAWLARQPTLNRPVVAVGAAGKLGFFGMAIAYWAAGDLPAVAVLQAMPDRVLGLTFVWWLRIRRPALRAAVATPVVH